MKSKGSFFPVENSRKAAMTFTRRLKRSLESSAFLALCLCTCCGPIADIRETLNPDLIPPLLLEVRTLDGGRLELTFDEAPQCRPEELSIHPTLEILSVRTAECRLVLETAGQIPGLPYTLEADYAKLFGSEMATKAALEAIQIHGGYGYMKEFPVERYLRDAKLLEIGEGTSEIIRLVIARGLGL